MKGSKYTEEQREQAIALIASGLSATAAGRKLNIPKSTVSHWWNTQSQDDEDVIAARTEARRASIKKCGRIVDKALGAIDRKVTAAAHECKAVTDGMAVLRKAAALGVIGLTEEEVTSLRKVVADYTGVGLREMSATMGDICKMQEALERQIEGGDTAGSVQVTFSGDSEVYAE